MKKIQEIVIKHTPDYDADLSWIGTFSDTPGEYAVEHSGGRGTYKYFNPQKGACESMEQAERDYKRMMNYENGTWGMVSIKAFAEIHTSQDGKTWKIDTISSSGLYGIESDSDEEYFKEIENEQLEELKDTLKEFGFTSEDFDNIAIEVKR